MRVKEVNLGKGLSRLEVEPTCFCERNIPTHVIDDIMRDIIEKKKRGDVNNRETCFRENRRSFLQQKVEQCWNPTRTPNREPDGIDVHVDRPLRENFRSHFAWADAMAKYRSLEQCAKDCDWPCKEPMRGMPQPKKNVEKVKCWSFVDDINDEFDDFDMFIAVGW